MNNRLSYIAALVLLMNNTKALFVILLFAIVSCSQSDYQDFDSDLTYSINSYDLRLDKYLSIGHEAPMSLQIVDRIPLLVFNNRAYKSIDIYKLGRSRLLKRIKLEDRVTESLNGVAAVHVFNLDSILLVNHLDPTKSCLVNGEGEYISRIAQDGKWNNIGIVNTIQASTNELVLKDSLIYISRWPIAINGSDDLGLGYKIAVSWNFNSGKLEYLDIHYPKNYIEQGISKFAAVTTWMVQGDNSLVFSFSQSDSLILYDLSSNQKHKSIIDSDLESTKPYPIRSNNLKIGDYAGALLNAGLLFDKTKKVYYSIRQMPIRNFSPADGYGFYDINIRKPIVIEVLDMNFSYLGSISLGACNYAVFKSFVHDGKLYLSTNSLCKDNVNENVLMFDVFDFDVNL